MTSLEKVHAEIRSRRIGLHTQNVVIDISREDVVYRICEEIVEAAMRSPVSPPRTVTEGRSPDRLWLHHRHGMLTDALDGSETEYKRVPADCVRANPPHQTNLRVTGFRGNPLRVVLSNGHEAAISQKLIDSFASPSPFEQHPDDAAVDRFAVAMKAKLAEKRADGAGGWDDPEACHIDYLAHLLKEQIHSRAALDLVDIGNFAMMIFNRGETPSHGR